ncbi:hypothetical protein U1Q18_014797, partial [Sarracenia purpurea var. burkii]
YPTLLSRTPTSPYAALYQGFLQPSLPHFSRQIYRALNSHWKTTMAEEIQYASGTDSATNNCKNSILRRRKLLDIEKIVEN